MLAALNPLERLRKAYAALLNDLHGLEWWMENLPAGMSKEEVGRRLRAIRADVAEHLLLEEQDGYLSPVLAAEPGARRRARELLGEHQSLLQSLDEIVHQAAMVGEKRVGLWKSVATWIHQLREHEAREKELFSEVGDEEACCR